MPLIPGNPILGGTTLIRAAIQSPNFQMSPLTGWSIDQDGNAYFETVTIGGGVVRVTFAATAPSSPNTGDVWFDLDAGGQPNTWNGSSWTAHSWGTDSIASQAVTTALIANNAVTAAQIANATITGTQLAASVTARSLGGITTTIASSAPGSPKTGDLWLDSANGNQLNQWNGTSWVALAWNAADVISAATITGSLIAASTITGGLIAAGTITASNIAANTITASLLAAGIVYAGIVDGTTISGATIIADGTSGDLLIYSGTPASGNLIASVSPVDGTDSHSNKFYAGTCSYQWSGGSVVAVTQLISGRLNVGSPAQIAGTGGASPGQIALDLLTPGAVSVNSGLTATGDNASFVKSYSQNANGGQRAVIMGGPVDLSSEGSLTGSPNGAWIYAESATGHARFRGNDGYTYSLGRLTARTNGTQVVNSAGQTLITGLSLTLGAGDWIIDAHVDVTADTATYTGFLSLGGTATVGTMNGQIVWLGNGQPVRFIEQTTFGTNTGLDVSFGSAGTHFKCWIFAHITVQTAGTVVINGATSGGDGFTTHIRSVLRAWPDAA